MIYDTLKKISNNTEKQWGEGIPLPNPSFAFEFFPSSTIQID
jgi:hypothetical protein